MDIVNSVNDHYVQLSSIERGIIKALIYFDIFNHPLTKEELHLNLPEVAMPDEVDHAVSSLLSKQLIYQFNNFYLLNNDRKHVEARIKANKKGHAYQKMGARISKFISCFPYVRAVALSGSVSKGVVGNKGDIDYFIITEPGRLWVCRTLLIAFKKMFLFNSRKYFCLNYFVDHENMLLSEKNIFTATELVHLYPTVNNALLEKMILHNHWTKAYYPNRNGIVNSSIHSDHSCNSIIKRMGEWLLAGSLGDRLDDYFHKLTYRKWEKKFRSGQGADFEINFRSTKGVSKHHPLGFQFRVTDAYNEKISSFEGMYNTSLAS